MASKLDLDMSPTFATVEYGLSFEHYVLTWEEKQEMMIWLNDYCINTTDIDMYQFWDNILLDVVNLPAILDLTDYDSSLFSDVSQIHSPKLNTQPSLSKDSEEKNTEQEETKEDDDDGLLSQDKNESRIDLYLAYINNEYHKINEIGSNIYKLNVLHNQIELLFDEFDYIINFGIKSKDIIQSIFYFKG